VPGKENEKYLQAAADRLEIARVTRNERIRAGLVALAQMWLDLANYRTDNNSFLTALETFNNRRMKKR
jgi:hypothetical protein